MRILSLASFFINILLFNNLHAVNFFPVTVSDLISDITTANSNNKNDTIHLGNGQFVLVGINNDDNNEGYNGLPSILADSGHTLTIRDGTIARSSALGTPGFRLIRVAPSASLILIGLTLENGLANDDNFSDFPGNGGGALLNDGTLQISSSFFLDNASTSLTVFGDAGGGAIYNGGTITLIEKSVFSGNYSALNFGGAIINNFDVATGTIPGVITTITDSTFSSDYAAVGGGAIANFTNIGTISNSTFSYNTAGQGGAINNGLGATISTIINSTLSNNAAIGYNLTSAFGGAISNAGTITNIINDTISYNSVAWAYNNGSSAQSGSGGGIYNLSTATIGNIESTIIAQNNAPVGFGPDMFGNMPSLESYNLIGIGGDGNTFTNGVNNDLVGSDTAPLNPLLGPLQNNGGPTLTRSPLTISPAIDSGANPNSLLYDQRGSPYLRTYGSQTDIGALEVQP